MTAIRPAPRTRRPPRHAADADAILYDNGLAACAICGHTGRWAIDHIEAT